MATAAVPAESLARLSSEKVSLLRLYILRAMHLVIPWSYVWPHFVRHPGARWS